jgi:hypothetical protein
MTSDGAPRPTGSAGLRMRQIVDRQEAESMVVDLAVGLAKKAYRLN